MVPMIGDTKGSTLRRRQLRAAAAGEDVSNVATLPDWTLGEDSAAGEESTRIAFEEQRQKRRDANRNRNGRMHVKARQEIINQPGPGPTTATTGPDPAATEEPEDEGASSESSVATDPETESEDSSNSEEEGEEEEDVGEEEEEEDAEESGEGGSLLPSTTSSGGGGLPASTGLPTETQDALPDTTTDLPDSATTAINSDEGSSGMSDQAELALIIVGALVGAVIIGIGSWFVYRHIRRRRDPSPPSPPPPYPEGPQPSRRVRLLAHVPFLKSRFADRTWFTIDEPYFASASEIGDEKHRSMTGTDLLGYMPDAAPLAAPPRAAGVGVGVGAPIVRRSVLDGDDKGYYTYDSSGAQPSSGVRDQPPWSPTESSLSSGFGNGTYIPPTPLHPPNRRAQQAAGQGNLQPPVPAIRRDTMYTEVSVASSVPRFRTVKSWVKQQRGRIGDDRTEAVPEQDYGLMMPDEEVPRRVEGSSQSGVGHAR